MLKTTKIFHAFIKYITKSCFCGELLTTDPFGEPLEKPMPLAVKMEDLLHEARRQRQHQIDWLRRSSSCRELVPAQEVAADDAIEGQAADADVEMAGEMAACADAETEAPPLAANADADQRAPSEAAVLATMP